MTKHTPEGMLWHHSIAVFALFAGVVVKRIAYVLERFDHQRPNLNYYNIKGVRPAGNADFTKNQDSIA